MFWTKLDFWSVEFWIWKVLCIFDPLVAGALTLLKYTKATINNINSVTETHQSKKCLNEVEMLCLTFSLIPIADACVEHENSQFCGIMKFHNGNFWKPPMSKDNHRSWCWPFLLEFYQFCISFRSQLIVLGIKTNAKEILAVKYSI